MSAQLVLVHGRSQQHKDAAALKGEWLAALRKGLAKAHLELPVPEASVRFPYYGQTLYDLVGGVPDDQVAEVIVRGASGSGPDPDEYAMARQIVTEIRDRTGITDEQLGEVTSLDVVARGPQDHEWIHAVLKALDRYVPYGSGSAIATFTRDVYHYLHRPGIRDQIETGIQQVMQPDLPTVVVGHSLGSVVAYNLLRRDGEAHMWDVPLFVTVGSPLAVTAIKRSLAPNKHPQCVGHWFNAMDERDVVALYPLNRTYFDIDPAVENKTDVQNDTDNRHSISGYLSDVDVAQRIHTALKD
jgi:hypothetical protein